MEKLFWASPTFGEGRSGSTHALFLLIVKNKKTAVFLSQKYFPNNGLLMLNYNN